MKVKMVSSMMDLRAHKHATVFGSFRYMNLVICRKKAERRQIDILKEKEGVQEL